MRKSVSPKAGLSVLRICGAILLAGTVSGCSSDASRFTSVFSTDNLTTASIPRGQSPLRNQPPVPAENIGSGGMYGQQQAMAQPMPAATYQQNTYQPTAARAASMPAPVQRAELSAPSGMAAPSASNNSERVQAMAQPFPSMPAKNGSGSVALGAPPRNLAEPSMTGSTPKKGQWSTVNATRVTLRPGETIGTLANRYGVPEREILKANGLTHSSDAATGQLVVIPSPAGGNAARAAVDVNGIPAGGKPGLPDGQQQNVAVLPTVPGARDKQQATTLAATGKTSSGAGAGTYVVKPGDSIARIAQQNGVSTTELKKANGLTTGAIRIGQVLTLPQKSGQVAAKPVAAKPVVADPVKTASVPAAGQPAEYKAPAATKSVSEVASVDPESSAPQATGIGKYRWPARGAVIANYGSNIDGKRSDGIAISVPTGTPIKAAENGVVIYAGNGLKELGNTVLIRHDDGKVTVYGHADSLSVQRGQKVQRGQTIATSGMSGNVSRPMLHFEVRKDAAPVNPITYLE